jgi:hypothetical protein
MVLKARALLLLPLGDDLLLDVQVHAVLLVGVLGNRRPARTLSLVSPDTSRPAVPDSEGFCAVAAGPPRFAVRSADFFDRSRPRARILATSSNRSSGVNWAGSSDALHGLLLRVGAPGDLRVSDRHADWRELGEMREPSPSTHYIPGAGLALSGLVDGRDPVLTTIFGCGVQ